MQLTCICVCVFVCEFLLPHVLYVCGGTDLCKRCPLPDGHKVRLNRKTTELYTVNPPPPTHPPAFAKRHAQRGGGGGVGCPVVLPAIKFMLQATKKRPSIKPPLSGTDLKIGKLQIGQPVNQTPTFFHRWKGTMWTFNEKKSAWIFKKKLKWSKNLYVQLLPDKWLEWFKPGQDSL